MDVTHQFFEYLRITDGFTMGDAIGWFLAVIAGIVGYKVIDTLQTSMERHNMLIGIEDGFSALYDSPAAMNVKDGKPDYNRDHVMVRSVLHDFSNWELIRDNTLPVNASGDHPLESKIYGGQRYIHIRNNKGSNGISYNEWIATQALHEITLKARRIEKMYKSNIIKRIDLADLFREIVPLGMSGRLEFIKEYYGAYDAECVSYLVMQTVVSCENYKNTALVEKFAKYYNAHTEIQELFTNNRRTRIIFDRWAVHKFNNIVKKYT